MNDSSKMYDHPRYYKETFILSTCGHTVHIKDSARLIDQTECLECHFKLCLSDTMFLLNHLRNVGFFKVDKKQSLTASKNVKMDDFDRVPLPPEPPYKYVKPLPKKRSERRQLEAHPCRQCEKYYAQVPSSHLKKSCRHRGPTGPPTPKHFWDLDFPKDYEIPIEKFVKKRTRNKYDKKIRMRKIINFPKEDDVYKKKFKGYIRTIALATASFARHTPTCKHLQSFAPTSPTIEKYHQFF
ncbi:hypothetical protein AVEN_122881-1 [Araneus ventricosus]|uniref:DNA endonuclease RBBP8 n=1 Tax=Araneus ventricosus TaxID=182803 RepID=A0A4Y2QQK2_ARAVE|nr:hypothetical protein AVEN_122881-1 [Araneus ventricosus]